MSTIPPEIYVRMSYRRYFNISPNELLMTPISIINTDLEMIELEGDIKEWKHPTKKDKKH